MCFRIPKPSPTTARVRFRYAVCDDCEATCGNCNFLATSSDIHTDSDLTSCIELPSVYPLVQYTDAPVDTASTARSLGQSALMQRIGQWLSFSALLRSRALSRQLLQMGVVDNE